MIVEGLKLTVLGMGMVFIFLILLVLFIHISSRILSNITEQEVKQIEEEARKEAELRRKKQVQPENQHRLTAVISAAIAAYKKLHP